MPLKFGKMMRSALKSGDLEKAVDKMEQDLAAEANTNESKSFTFPPTYVEGFHDEASVRKMKYRPLGETGMVVSILSFGASSLGSVFRETKESESIAVVHTALKAGINLIDTAPWYGHGKSETVLGKALRGVPRKAYYLNTKVGRYQPDFANMFDFSAERTIRSVYESLDRLGLEYIDCIQVHDPEFAASVDIIVRETLPALALLKKAGVVRKIGMTGYPLAHQQRLIEAATVKIDTSITYCHYSLNDRTLTDSFLPFLQSKGIGCINASPISMGLLATRGPPAWHPASVKIKTICAEAAAYCTEQGVNISTLAMNFTLSNEQLPTTLVSTASLQRMKSNIASVYTPLTALESKVLGEIMDRFFNKLTGDAATWEGLEVDAYWKARATSWSTLVAQESKQRAAPSS